MPPSTVKETIAIGERRVGKGEPCFIIGEAGVNHNGSFELALELVDVAACAGCDAVKFQTFKPERVCSPYAPKADYVHPRRLSVGVEEVWVNGVAAIDAGKLTGQRAGRVLLHTPAAGSCQ